MIQKIQKLRRNKGKKAPSLAHVVNLKGQPIDTATLRGKVVLLDFWATWCGPCNAEFPFIEDLYQKYQNNPDVKFVILGGFHNSFNDVKKWKKNHDYTFPVYYDRHAIITAAYGIKGVPTTFIIDKNGRIQFKNVGYSMPSIEKKLAAKINMALKKDKTTAKSKHN